MTTSQFRRAKLVPFDAGGRNPQEARAIPLDFNPETLTLKVSGGEQRDRSRRGRQQVQNVGASKATLSFECIFDSTRPRDASDSSTGGEEMLDVRTRSKPIADLLQVYGSGREQAPRRVQFRWGTLIFNGVISQHQEVFDYFSPSGVPLRSKLSITLTEQEFRYEVSATDAAQRRQAVEQASAGARSQAAAAGASSLMGGGSGLDLSAGFDLSAGLNLDLNLDMSLSAQVGLSASLGLSADIGVSVGAGINLDASAAVDLFGPAALGSDADLGRSGVAIPQPSPGLAAAGVPPSPWAPDGPAPGRRAAGPAPAVSSPRAGGAGRGGAPPP
ncbi:CIS tube protein, partial [Zoogloea ramigera]|uniref:CIS tube protein n=1 Tax=Zoogloea ramigera TaxID=350 RepID=UPI003FA300FB